MSLSSIDVATWETLLHGSGLSLTFVYTSIIYSLLINPVWAGACDHKLFSDSETPANTKFKIKIND